METAIYAILMTWLLFNYIRSSKLKLLKILHYSTTMMWLYILKHQVSALVLKITQISRIQQRQQINNELVVQTKQYRVYSDLEIYTRSRSIHMDLTLMIYWILCQKHMKLYKNRIYLKQLIQPQTPMYISSNCHVLWRDLFRNINLI